MSEKNAATEKLVTQDNVNSIADNLVEQGHPVTARAIRSQLGGGSMTTVLECLQAWKAGQKLKAAPTVDSTPLSPNLADALRSLGERFVADVRAEEKSKTDKIAAEMRVQVEEANEARVHAERELIEATNENDTLNGMWKQQDTELAILKEEKVRLEENLKAEHSNFLIAKEDADRTRADAQHAQAAAAGREAELQEKLAVATKHGDTLAKDQEAATAQLKALGEQLAQAQLDTRAAQAELTQRDKLITQIQAHLEASKTELKGTLDELAQVKLQEGLLKGQVLAGEQQVKDLKTEVAAARAEAQAANKEAARLQGQIEVLGKQKPEPEPSKKS